MHYVSAGSVEESVRRIMERSYRGGHSASERLLREIYNKSTQNFLKALNFAESRIETVRVYDNSEAGGQVRQLLAFPPRARTRDCKRDSGVAGIALSRNGIRNRRLASTPGSERPRLSLRDRHTDR